MALLGLVVLPVSIGLCLLGPRYLPAPEVALILRLETVLGPYWVWLALGGEPGARAPGRRHRDRRPGAALGLVLAR